MSNPPGGRTKLMCTDPRGCARADNKRAPSHLATRESRIRSASVSALFWPGARAGQRPCLCWAGRLLRPVAMRGRGPVPPVPGSRPASRAVLRPDLASAPIGCSRGPPGRGICNRFASRQLSQIACGPCPPRPGPPLGPPLGPPTLSPPPLGSPLWARPRPLAGPRRRRRLLPAPGNLHDAEILRLAVPAFGRWSRSHYSCSRTR